MARLKTKCKVKPHGGVACKRGRRSGSVRGTGHGMWAWTVRKRKYGPIIAQGEHGRKAVAVAKVREYLKTKHKGYGD